VADATKVTLRVALPNRRLASAEFGSRPPGPIRSIEAMPDWG
jgi:hypothetical protein